MFLGQMVSREAKGAFKMPLICICNAVSCEGCYQHSNCVEFERNQH
jgi:hypothetical protein